MSDAPKQVDAAISRRTRQALSEAKARGVQLGKAGADNLRATVEKRKSAADAFAKQHAALFAEFVAQAQAAGCARIWTRARVRTSTDVALRPS